jgi:hypothetical protein
MSLIDERVASRVPSHDDLDKEEDEDLDIGGDLYR